MCKLHICIREDSPPLTCITNIHVNHMFKSYTNVNLMYTKYTLYTTFTTYNFYIIYLTAQFVWGSLP